MLLWVLIMGRPSEKSVLLSNWYRLFKQLVQWLSLALNLSILPRLSGPMIHLLCRHMLLNSCSNAFRWPHLMIIAGCIAAHRVHFRTLANLRPSLAIDEKHWWLSLLLGHSRVGGLIRRIVVSSGAWLARSARVILGRDQTYQRQRTILHLFGGDEDLFRRWPCRQHIEHDFLTVNAALVIIIRGCMVDSIRCLDWHLSHFWWGGRWWRRTNLYWWSWLVSWMRRVHISSMCATLLRWTLIVVVSIVSFLKLTSLLHLLLKHVDHHALDLLWLLTYNVSGHQLRSLLRHISLIKIYRCQSRFLLLVIIDRCIEGRFSGGCVGDLGGGSVRAAWVVHCWRGDVVHVPSQSSLAEIILSFWRRQFMSFTVSLAIHHQWWSLEHFVIPSRSFLI